jgi:hypothetical protein
MNNAVTLTPAPLPQGRGELHALPLCMFVRVRGTTSLDPVHVCEREGNASHQMLCRRIALRRDSAIALRIAAIVPW